MEYHIGQQDGSPRQAPSDSRTQVPCKFLSRPGGCQKGSCPFLHTRDSREVEKSSNLDFELNKAKASSYSLAREEHTIDAINRTKCVMTILLGFFLGALVYFNEFGHIHKISLPTDYSLACITGLAPEITPEAIVNILRGLGFNLNVDCIRIPRHTASSETKATVKVEDPLFAQELSTRLKNQRSALSAAPVAIDARRTNCRKVHTSWYKATRSVWLNFGSGKIANRLGQKFNEGIQMSRSACQIMYRKEEFGPGFSLQPCGLDYY